MFSLGTIKLDQFVNGHGDKLLHVILMTITKGGAMILIQWGQNHKIIYNYGIIV